MKSVAILVERTKRGRTFKEGKADANQVCRLLRYAYISTCEEAFERKTMTSRNQVDKAVLASGKLICRNVLKNYST